MDKDRGEPSQLNNSDFNFICKFVHDTTGIVLNDNKREMVYRRLTHIVRDRKFSSFTDYCHLLKSSPEKESDYFINAITTNLTSFFREQHHFDYIKNHEVPRLLNHESDNNKRLRIWSSASSTGEEPYSIALTLMESMLDVIKHWDVKILATDIDSNVLATGKAGIYDESRIIDIPNILKEKYFLLGTGANSNKVRLAQRLQSLITFKQLNLLNEWPMKGPFDIIFCRNVIIYFDKATQQDLFERFYQLLKPGGLLLLGHSENLGFYQKNFENVGRTIFRKPYT